jgi:hypothetical protein
MEDDGDIMHLSMSDDAEEATDLASGMSALKLKGNALPPPPPQKAAAAAGTTATTSSKPAAAAAGSPVRSWAVAAGANPQRAQYCPESSDGSDSDSSTANHSISPMALRRPEGLSDAAWKRLRNRTLLGKMLELETPTITDKMIEFLMHEGVCECFISFITQVTATAATPASAYHSATHNYFSTLCRVERAAPLPYAELNL